MVIVLIGEPQLKHSYLHCTLKIFMDKLGEISKHEAYNRALKHPQLKCQEASELVFDNKFCAAFKLSEHAVVNKLESALSTSTAYTANILYFLSDLVFFWNFCFINCFNICDLMLFQFVSIPVG